METKKIIATETHIRTLKGRWISIPSKYEMCAQQDDTGEYFIECDFDRCADFYVAGPFETEAEAQAHLDKFMLNLNETK